MWTLMQKPSADHRFQPIRGVQPKWLQGVNKCHFWRRGHGLSECLLSSWRLFRISWLKTRPLIRPFMRSHLVSGLVSPPFDYIVQLPVSTGENFMNLRSLSGTGIVNASTIQNAFWTSSSSLKHLLQSQSSCWLVWYPISWPCPKPSQNLLYVLAQGQILSLNGAY